MRDFEPLKFSLAKAETSVAKFRSLLEQNKILQEKKDIQPFFRANPDFCGLLGHLNPNAGVVDLISFELSYFRDFSSDVALGDRKEKAFTLIELEDATEESVFAKSTKHQPDWSSRLEHGHSQIVDWIWRLDDWRTTSDFDATFGKGAHAFTLLLIAGRDHFLDETMKQRMEWRRDHVVIQSKKILIYTYDQLLKALETKVQSFRALMPEAKPIPIQPGEG